MPMSTKHEMVKEAMLSTPPAGVVGLTLAGVSLQDWVFGVTLIWLGIQITWFGYQRFKEFRGKEGVSKHAK